MNMYGVTNIWECLVATSLANGKKKVIKLARQRRFTILEKVPNSHGPAV